MFEALYQAFWPAPLSMKWMQRHAHASSRAEFEAAVRAAGATPIYHLTDQSAARSIYETEKFFGSDVVSAGHFHYQPDACDGQALRAGVLLGFAWSGERRAVCIGRDMTTHADRSPNVLFEAPRDLKGLELWELRLYPGTTGLMLTYVEIGDQGFMLNARRHLTVIHGV